MNHAFKAIDELMKTVLLSGEPNFVGYVWANKLPPEHNIGSMADHYGLIASHDKTRDGFYIQRVEVRK